jgi:uncharacterized membrane protein
MRTRKIITLTVAILIIVVAIIIIAIAFLPYPTLKSLADSVMPDGNFKALNENNVIVFKILLGWIGLSMGIAGAIIACGYFHQVIAWLHQYSLDMRQFVMELRPKTKDFFAIIFLLLVLVCAATIRADQLNGQITHDEAYTYVVFSSTSIFNIVTNYHLPNNHVLNSLLIDLSTHLFGAQPWAVRLPALIAGLLLILATYAIARQIYGKYTSLLSAVLIAILPGAIQYSTHGRGYVFVSLFTMLCLSLANYLRKNNNLFAWSLLAICAALGFYSVPVMLFPFGMVFAWLFFENIYDNKKRANSKVNFVKNWSFTGITSVILVLLLYTPIFIYSGPNSVFANQFVQSEPWGGYLASIPSTAMAVWRDWTIGLPFMVTVLLQIGFCLSLILDRKIATNRFPLQLAAVVGIGLLILVQRPRAETKVWTFLQAPFMIWCAAGIMGLIHTIPIKFSRKTFLATVMVIMALLASSVTAFRIFPHLRDNWVAKNPVENTAIALKNQISPSDLIIVDSPFDAPIWYYSKIAGTSSAYFNQSLPFERLFVIVCPTSGQTLQSVLQSRGPESDQVDIASAQLVFSFGFLDTYIVPHR